MVACAGYDISAEANFQNCNIRLWNSVCMLIFSQRFLVSGGRAIVHVGRIYGSVEGGLS